MQLYHITHTRNLLSIRTDGLTLAQVSGKRQCVWLCTTTRIEWAKRHLSDKRGWKPHTLAVFSANVPNRWLRRHRRGIWCCERPIPAKRLTLIDDGMDALLTEQ